jgi:hypothetical protein
MLDTRELSEPHRVMPLPPGMMDIEELISYRHLFSVRAHLNACPERISRAHVLIGAAERLPLTISPLPDQRTLLSFDGVLEDWSRVHEAQIEVVIGGSRYRHSDLVASQLDRDPWRQLTARFRDHATTNLSQARVLELGSRIRQDTKVAARNTLFASVADYVGMDIVPGENVRVVGDCHSLPSYFEPHSFDLIYSDWVFEHLLMPWMVIVGMNQILRTGGEVFINTNHSIGLHDIPWDFWRYSNTAWHALFNEYTGFEIIDAALGEPVRCVPIRYHAGFQEYHGGAGYQASAVWARKIGEASVAWDVDPAKLLAKLGMRYPKEIKGGDS